MPVKFVFSSVKWDLLNYLFLRFILELNEIKCSAHFLARLTHKRISTTIVKKNKYISKLKRQVFPFFCLFVFVHNFM